jgi:hypothetical protein
MANISQINGLLINAATASLATTASFATTVNTVTAAINYEYFPTFVDADNGSASPEALYTDAGIRYNPSTNILTTTASFALAVAGGGGGGGDTTAVEAQFYFLM